MSGPRTPPPSEPVPEPAGPRPMVERIGLGLIALVLALLFGAMALAAFENGEVFLGVMAGIAVLMTLWAAGSSLLRG